jgi:hypothetical protein
MNSENPFEQSRLRDRLKEVFILAVFTIAIAVISIVAMNLLVFPVTVFAIGHKAAFNIVFKFLGITGIFAFLFSMVLVTGFRLRKAGLSAGNMVVYMLRRPLYYCMLFFTYTAVTSIILYFLYVMLSNNYYFLYTLTNK